MKRRETKKHIRREEKLLAKCVQAYLKSYEQGNKETNYKAGKLTCSTVAELLALYLHLDPSWDHKGLWIDGLIDGHIHLRRTSEISIHGEMVWGLLRDVGGHQWKEPFSAVLRVAKARGKIDSYSLRFGKDAPLPEKLVESGSYYMLLPESELALSSTGGLMCSYTEIDGAYMYNFSKRGKAQ